MQLTMQLPPASTAEKHYANLVLVSKIHVSVMRVSIQQATIEEDRKCFVLVVINAYETYGDQLTVE